MRKKQTNASEYTVSEISGALRKTIEDTYGNVRIRGEISGFRGPHASGHAYFALKDEKARLDAVIWRSVLQRLKYPPEEGLEVIASGRMSSYAGSSRYQIIIDSIEPAGAGALMALLEERRKKLAQEGLFQEDRKKPLPFMPKTIGVITSPTGAVIRDIIHRIRDRFPLHIVVWPVRVQGETAGAEAAAAIKGFNALSANTSRSKVTANIPRPDLLIVARGGGSLEDLWSFNDEELVRAAGQSALPIISAIGHETDWTLLDYVADRRAPTPTGAAEIAVPVKADLNTAIFELGTRLHQAEQRFLSQNRQAFQTMIRALPSADRLLADPRRRLDESGTRLGFGLLRMVQFKQNSFSGLSGRLSPALFTRSTNQKRQSFIAITRALPPVERLLSEPKKRLNDSKSRFSIALQRLVQFKQTSYNAIRPRLSHALIVRQTADKKKKYDQLCQQFNKSFIHNTQQHIQRLEIAAKLIKNLSIDSILKRGFALISDNNNNKINTVSAVSPDQDLRLLLADGQILATARTITQKDKSNTVSAKTEHGKKKPVPDEVKKQKKRKKQIQDDPKKDTPKQGNLF